MTDTAYTYFSKQLLDITLNPLLENAGGDSLYNDLVLSTGTNGLLLNVTAEQYKLLLSSAFEGALKMYPDNYLNVVYPLFRAGKMLICEAVADCIDTSENVQNNLYAYLILSGLITNQINPTETIVQDRFPVSAQQTEIVSDITCDKDILWAQCIEMATRLDALGKDVIETIQAQVDPIERAAIAIDIIPLIGTVLSSSILAITENIDDIYNGYLAYSSQSLIESIACDLFLAHCDNCTTPTYEQLIDYYSQYGIDGIDDWRNVVYQAFVDYFTGSSGLSNQIIYYTAISFALYTLYLESKVLNYVGTKTVQLWAQLATDNPSSDWVLLCPCVANWQWDSSFTTDQNIWIPTDYGAGPNGTWTNGIGWQSVDSANPRSRCIIIEANFASTTINTIEMTYNYVKGTPNIAGSSAINVSAWEPDDTLHVQNINFSDTVDGTGLTITLNVGGLSIDKIGCLVRSSVDATSPYTYGGSVALTAISITGSGTNPFA